MNQILHSILAKAITKTIDIQYHEENGYELDSETLDYNSTIFNLAYKVFDNEPELLETLTPNETAFYIFCCKTEDQFTKLKPYIEKIFSKSRTAIKVATHRLAKLSVDYILNLNWLDYKTKGAREVALEALLIHKSRDAIEPLKIRYSHPKTAAKDSARIRIALAKLGCRLEAPAISIDDLNGLVSKHKLKKGDLVDSVITDHTLEHFSPLNREHLQWLFDITATCKSLPLPDQIESVLNLIPTENRSLLSPVLLDSWLAKQGEVSKDNRGNYWVNIDPEGKKYHWLLFLVGFLGTDKDVPEIEKQIRIWKKSDYKRSIRMVEVLKQIGTNFALSVMYDVYTKSSSGWSIREKTQEILTAIAEEKGVSLIDLQDIVVPDFGLAEGNLELDTGARKFSVNLNHDLSLSVTNQQTGKVTKTLPKANSEESGAKRKAVEEEFKKLNSNIKKVAKAQGPRLEVSLFCERSWPLEFWKELYQQHPILRKLGQALIWQTRETSKSFRVSEDYSLIDAESDVISLNGVENILLWHPFDRKKEEIELWTEHFEDYELIPIIDQLHRLSTLPEENELWRLINETKIETTFGKINSFARKHNFREGDQDGSWLFEFYRPLPILGKQITIHMEDYRRGSHHEDNLIVDSINFTSVSEPKHLAKIPRSALCWLLELRSELEG